ncbi:MAG: MerR family transcriptional regulator [Zhenhengia sp.]|uniref:MerR family transcriptional regulator n=1 Tax=Zhenhengia sp. TaxID=2944208 RepID=UPI003993A50E
MNTDPKYITELQQKYQQSVKPRTIKVIAQILGVDADELQLYEEELGLEISEIKGSSRVYRLKGLEIFYKILKMREVGCEIDEIEYVINKLGSDRQECYQALLNSKINQNRSCRTNNNFIDQQYIQESDQSIRPISQSVAGYKNKIDILIELLADYKQERDRNKSLQEQLQIQVQQLHEMILELKQEHQAKIQELQEKHNAEIEQYQAKYKELLEHLGQKTVTTKAKEVEEFFAGENPFK